MNEEQKESIEQAFKRTVEGCGLCLAYLTTLRTNDELAEWANLKLKELVIKLDKIKQLHE